MSQIAYRRLWGPKSPEPQRLNERTLSVGMCGKDFRGCLQRRLATAQVGTGSPPIHTIHSEGLTPSELVTVTGEDENLHGHGDKRADIQLDRLLCGAFQITNVRSLDRTDACGQDTSCLGIGVTGQQHANNPLLPIPTYLTVRSVITKSRCVLHDDARLICVHGNTAAQTSSNHYFDVLLSWNSSYSETNLSGLNPTQQLLFSGFDQISSPSKFFIGCTRELISQSQQRIWQCVGCT